MKKKPNDNNTFKVKNDYLDNNFKDDFETDYLDDISEDIDNLDLDDIDIDDTNLDDNLNELNEDDVEHLTKEEMDYYADKDLSIIGGVLKKLDFNCDYEEAISIAYVGFSKALMSYNKKKGAKFTTYAFTCIKNEVLAFMRKSQKDTNNISLNAILSTDKNGNDLQLADTLADTGKDSILEDVILRNEEYDFLLKAIDKLSERERIIILARFGLNGYKEKTQKDLAKEIGMSQANISKIQEKAIKKLKLILKEYM